jgi:DNA-binding LacI/PurR family transcriptional regulator
MKTSRTKTIGILIADFSNPFYSELFKGIEAVSRQHGYLNMICISGENAENEMASLETLVNRKIDGIIFCSYNRVEKNINHLLQISKTIPVVFMDPVMVDEPVNCVLSDGFTWTKKATHYLIGRGKRRIAYIKGSSKHWVTNERFQGYVRALEEAGLEVDAGNIYEGNFQMRSGFEGAEYFMQKENPPDAIMAATDVMAIGAMKYLRYAQIAIPDQVSVVGFDNIPLASLMEPGLTTVAQNIQELGRCAAEMIIKKIKQPDMENQKIVLDCELIVRGSTDKTKPCSVIVS